MLLLVHVNEYFGMKNCSTNADKLKIYGINAKHSFFILILSFNTKAVALYFYSVFVSFLIFAMLCAVKLLVRSKEKWVKSWWHAATKPPFLYCYRDIQKCKTHAYNLIFYPTSCAFLQPMPAFLCFVLCKHKTLVDSFTSSSAITNVDAINKPEYSRVIQTRGATLAVDLNTCCVG